MEYQIIFTFILLIFLIFLQDWMLPFYKLVLLISLAVGFSFSWLFRKHKEDKIKGILTLASILVVFWLIYSLFTGTLLYKEIIIKCLKAVWILIAIFSFHARPYILQYIQILSIVVFLSHCLFVTDYKPILILGYLILWVFILRGEFLRLFFEKGLKDFIKQRSLLLSIGLFVLAILISLFFLNYRLRNKEFKKGGMFFWKEKLEADYEKEYYILQKEFQNKILNLIPTLETQEQKYEIISIISSFIKETPYMTELDSAEERLVQSFTPTEKTTFRQEKTEAILSAKNFLDKKLTFILNRENETISNILKKYPFNIKERIEFASALNKIYNSSDYYQIKEYLKRLLNSIERSTLESNSKRELKDSLYRLYSVKLFEIYRKQIDSLKGDVSKEDKKKDFLDLISEIRKIEDYTDFKEIKKELQDTKDKKIKEPKEFLERIKELFRIKEEFLNYELLRKLNEKIDESGIAEYEKENLKDNLDKVIREVEYKKIKEKIERIQTLLPKDLKVEEEFGNISESIAERFLEKNEEDIKKSIETSILDMEQKDKFFKQIEDLKKSETIEELNNRFSQMMQKIEEFLKQGFISSEIKEKISDQLEELKSILGDSLEKTETASAYYPRKNYRDMIKKLPLDNEKKAQMEEIIERLSIAENLLEIEKLANLFNNELDNLSKELSPAELNRIKKEFSDFFEFRKSAVKDKLILELENKLKQISEIDSKKAEELNKYLRELKEAKDFKIIQEKVKNLKDAFLDFRSKSETKTEEKKVYPYQLYLLPQQLIIPKNGLGFLKPLLVYNGIFFKEVKKELNWYSSEPLIAWVDNEGLVHPVSLGTTEVFVVYNDIKSNSVQVTVIDTVSEEKITKIKKEIGFFR